MTSIQKHVNQANILSDIHRIIQSAKINYVSVSHANGGNVKINIFDNLLYIYSLDECTNKPHWFIKLTVPNNARVLAQGIYGIGSMRRKSNRGKSKRRKTNRGKTKRRKTKRRKTNRGKTKRRKTKRGNIINQKGGNKAYTLMHMLVVLYALILLSCSTTTNRERGDTIPTRDMLNKDMLNIADSLKSAAENNQIKIMSHAPDANISFNIPTNCSSMNVEVMPDEVSTPGLLVSNFTNTERIAAEKLKTAIYKYTNKKDRHKIHNRYGTVKVTSTGCTILEDNILSDDDPYVSFPKESIPYINGLHFCEAMRSSNMIKNGVYHTELGYQEMRADSYISQSILGFMEILSGYKYDGWHIDAATHPELSNIKTLTIDQVLTDQFDDLPKERNSGQATMLMHYLGKLDKQTIFRKIHKDGRIETLAPTNWWDQAIVVQDPNFTGDSFMQHKRWSGVQSDRELVTYSMFPKVD
jgi:hypothetical protein